MAQTSRTPYKNHGLLSHDFYETAELLRSLTAEEVGQVEALRDVYGRAEPLVVGAKEAVIEDELVKPVLRVLGFVPDVKPSLPTEEGAREPDFALFGDDAALREAAQFRGTQEYFDAALALCEAKPWDQPLGVGKGRQAPGAQLRSYLFDSRVRWGILTNGRVWRLYEREISVAGFRYYEVELPRLLDDDVQDFLCFYLIFGCRAFERDPAKEGQCWLDGMCRPPREWGGVIPGYLDRRGQRRTEARERLDTRLVQTILNSPFETPEGTVDTVYGYVEKREPAAIMAVCGVVVADAEIVVDAQLQTKAILFINFGNAKRRGPLKGTEFERASAKALTTTIRNHPAFIDAGRRKRVGGVHVRWTMLDWEMIRHMSP